ncbi:hypothetical protein D3C84_728170 [compost metagenome]
MLAQGVGDLVAHHRRQFVVSELELIDQAAVDDDLAARTAVGVELVAVDHVGFPGPLRGIRTERGSLGDQALGDGVDAACIGAVLVQHALLRRLAQRLLVGLGVHLVELGTRQHAEHVLLALDTHCPAAGGID